MNDNENYVIIPINTSLSIQMTKWRRWWQRWYNPSCFMSEDILISPSLYNGVSRVIYSPRNHFLYFTSKLKPYHLSNLSSDTKSFILVKLGKGKYVKPLEHNLTFYATDTITLERVLDLDNPDDFKLIVDNNPIYSSYFNNPLYNNQFETIYNT